jgi:hypothetical protein
LDVIRIGINEAALKAWEKRVEALVRDLGSTWTASLALSNTPREPYPTLGQRNRARTAPQPTNSEVIDHLAKGGRDVFTLTPAMRAEILREVLSQVRVRGGLVKLAGAALMVIVATAWRRVVLEHRRRGGDGIAQPGAAWAARKAALGLQPGSLKASGQMLTDVAGAQLIVQRKA